MHPIEPFRTLTLRYRSQLATKCRTGCWLAPKRAFLLVKMYCLMNHTPNRIALLALLLVGVLGNAARSYAASPSNQAYPLRSLTGERAVFYVSFNANTDVLSIRYARDTIRVRDVLFVQRAQVLSASFLLLAFRIQAGVGLHVTRTLLLSAYDHRICPSLSVTSGFQEDFMDFSQHRTSPKRIDVKTRYAADLSVRERPGTKAATYYVTATVHGKIRSLLEPERNSQYARRVTLAFDPKQHLFYEAQEYLTQQVQVFDPKTQRDTVQKLQGRFPVLTLGDYKYVYQNQAWYELTESADLIKYTD